MAITVNKKGLAHARSLISSGKLDKDSFWSFSAEDGNALLGSNGDDWGNYASYFLAEDSSATEKTKDRFKYPFGKDGKVYRSGLVAIRSRAGQQNETDVFDAAGKLIDEIDKKDESTSANDREQGILIAATDIVIDPSTRQLPTEIEVLIEGHHGKKQRLDGAVVDVTFSGRDIDRAVEHANARRERHANRDFVIDYEHQTLSGNEAPAAGWCSTVRSAVRDGKKVAIAKVSQWTKRAAERILAGEYRYLSPVFVMNATDKETGRFEPLILKNVALTNEPFIDSLMPIISKTFFESTTIQGKGTAMDETMSWLRSFLNLPLTATPQDILMELQKLAEQIKSSIGSTAAATAKDLLAFLSNVKSEIAGKANLLKEICGKDGATVEEATAVYATAKSAMTEVVAARQELATLKAEKQTSEFNTVIAKAFEAGKILPVQKNDSAWLETQKAFAMKDMTAFVAFWDKQPKIAPTGALPQTDAAPVTSKDVTPEALEIGQVLGNDRAAIEKYGV